MTLRRFHSHLLSTAIILLAMIAMLVVASRPPATWAQDSDGPVTLPVVTGTDIRFTALTGEEGLSSSNVYDITQDEQGFMWFATADGLNRYDGYSFRIFRF